VAHGDLKPDNLLLGADGRVRICDFGTARLCSPDDRMLRTVGTPAFFTPEMCEGRPYSACQADLWALGVCLYVLIFGARSASV
jgi:[calcium/calmodulin-dependent protein kinase] kinase